MKKIALATIFIWISVSLSGRDRHVMFGERDRSKDSCRWFFDKDGFTYPSTFISDSSLSRANQSLLQWYQQHEREFLTLSAIAGCHFDRFTDQNAHVFNDSLNAGLLRKLNIRRNGIVTFFIHGFRKAFVTDNRDTDSQEDYGVLGKTFRKYYQRNSVIIEIYWDGLYDCCFSTNTRKNDQLFQMFEEAQTNAEKVGNGLRNLLNKVKADTMNIVTYSLGARVAVYSLFDTDSSGFRSPRNKRVNICMLAAAISPDLIQHNFIRRSTPPASSQIDNYALYIIYNENDFVLKKKIGAFGPGPFKHGVTTLGCNWNGSAIRLAEHFKSNWPGSRIRLYNVNGVGKCHLVSCYCSGDFLQLPFTELATNP